MVLLMLRFLVSTKGKAWELIIPQSNTTSPSFC